MDGKEDGEPPKLYQSPQVIFVRVGDGGGGKYIGNIIGTACTGKCDIARPL